MGRCRQGPGQACAAVLFIAHHVSAFSTQPTNPKFAKGGHFVIPLHQRDAPSRAVIAHPLIQHTP
eukprot:4417414-Prorocentrum_lima.AAC.1